ncbi:tripartite tricarboxylate transporter permease [Candidatus Njordibacter sp. Uisw_002]|jgi:putative tricarboxylic transport membrane protein|uniref:tripartite tricarboxylate transporter permease n=1 Tax=Candidatus Njordibacter sp. Uisw_002 TaxID=3230971 RepID=UPI003D404A88|tara:strand:- start:2806 stop:4317 length:1512 start_codon:yes stop_codon:yes gene_type:complete
MSVVFLFDAFQTIFSDPYSLMFILIGVTAGVVVGCLPGLTATMGCALLVPFTFSLDPVQGLLMLMGIFTGGIYGGSISGILIRTPGTPAAAATLIDGYPLALKGEAGKAIGIATIASFVGGVIGALIMAFLAPEIAQFGLRFGPAEFFALAVFGLTMIISISGESLLKGAIAALFGLLLTTIGFDPLSGVPRFSFGNENLLGGITFIPALIGLFGFAQVFRNIEKMEITPHVKSKVGKILPSFKEIKSLFPTMLKSGGMGTFTGSVPGLGADVAAFVAYGEAKRTSKHPEQFGKGALEGVAAPEAANNGATGGAMIPMLTLGVPGDAVTAVLLGALTIHGFQPGPLMFRDNLDIVYPIFAGMILCQFVLLFVGLSGARLFAKLINIDNKVLTPIIFLLCIVGSYSMRFSFWDVGLALTIGVLAYFMERAKFPVSPILLALILGPMAEQNMRRALMLSHDDPSIFLTRPLSAAFLILAVFMAVTSYKKFKKLREIERDLTKSGS